MQHVVDGVAACAADADHRDAWPKEHHCAATLHTEPNRPSLERERCYLEWHSNPKGVDRERRESGVLSSRSLLSSLSLSSEAEVEADLHRCTRERTAPRPPIE